jgi:hypothetical protein
LVVSLSAGNFQNLAMYKKGSACTACPSGTSCSKTNPGLCSGTPVEGRLATADELQAEPELPGPVFELQDFVEDPSAPGDLIEETSGGAADPDKTGICPKDDEACQQDQRLKTNNPFSPESNPKFNMVGH